MFHRLSLGEERSRNANNVLFHSRSRDIASADFGLNVGSQGTREERQLMRQRGAG